VEIVEGRLADFTELLRMVQREWSIQGSLVVHVTLVLLTIGEGVDF
jgi:hypothetical protein